MSTGNTPVMTDELKAKLKTYRLNEAEYGKVRELLGREPQNVEWALFSALWSEHCSYKSSKVHLKGLFNTSKRVVQSFGENAGVVDLGEGERIAFKIESHNHPSFIEPYQGAATGVGGILRDIFTMGARPIALADYLCFGEPTPGSLKPGATTTVGKTDLMPRLVDGVVRGIGGYGNCVGVPTITGQTEFHESYNGNILVNAMAVGLFRPGEKIFLSKATGAGNWVVYVGAKTGRDGVHGASMASESFAADSAAKRPTVQIGDPFFEKLLIESCIEVMKLDLVAAIQDMGAAGITSSSFEMASKGGVGLRLDLDHVPLRDSSMTPEDVLLSESQERMLLICEPSKYKELAAVFHRWGLDAVKIGEVTTKKTVELFWKGDRLTEIDPDILVENAPQYQRPYKKLEPQNRVASRAEIAKALAPVAKDTNAWLKSLLVDPRGTGREWVYRQYDCRVGARTARDCRDSVGVLSLKDSGRALGVVLGCRPYVMRFDARVGGLDAVAYPALELALKGFEALAVTDCLNYGNPERENVMTDFVASLDGMNSICRELEAPIISGNVSFYNETMGKNITPTPSTGLIGLRKSLEHLPQSFFTAAGHDIFVLRIPMLKMGGLAQEKISSTISGVGELNAKTIADGIRTARHLADQTGVESTRVIGKFGLAYALARMSLEGVGAKIDLAGLKMIRPEGDVEGLFEEHMYEAIFAVASSKSAAFVAANQGAELHRIGQTQMGRLEIATHIGCDTAELQGAFRSGWQTSFPQLAGH